jgi:hypothetical protein
LEGDFLTLKSASRAKADQVVRIKQLGEALTLAVGFTDPKTMLPVYDASPIVEEILLALDVGRPKRIVWTPQDLMMRAAMSGGSPGGGEGGQPDSGKGKADRQKGPPDAQHESGAARRVGT